MDDNYKDDTVLTWGAHKGKKLANVPAHYLLWVYNQDWMKSPTRSELKALKEYINDNMELLKKGK